MMNMRNLIGLFVVLIIYIVGLYPVMQDMINAAVPTMDSTSAFLLQLVPVAFLIGLLASIFLYATGRLPSQQEYPQQYYG